MSANEPDASEETRSSDEVPAGGWRQVLAYFRSYSDIVAAILLSFATLSTAWCAYEATRWSGVQAKSFAEASANRIESHRQFNLGLQVLTIDAELFLQWLEAYHQDDNELREFYESNLIRPEFLPYLNEWVASQPLVNPDALRHPLESESYQQTLLVESQRLSDVAEAKFTEATEANQTADDYVLGTVLFASVLFFAGISGKFERVAIRVPLVSLAFIMLVLGVVLIAALPIH
jgi:hypothetical protein